MFKKYLFLTLMTLSSPFLFAQLDRIPPSPLQKIEQKVGLTDITIEYSRPSMKGRKIFGDLVPYHEMWRTGANRNTKITFSTDVTIGGGILKAGTYALFTKPSNKTWDIYFYSDITNWDVPDTLEMNEVATMIRVTSRSLSHPIETMTITIDDITETSSTLGIAWEKTYIGIPIEIHTHQRMTELIDKQLNRNSIDYHIAAAYLQERGLELPKAKILMEKAILLNNGGSVWDHLVMSLIHDQMGNRTEAMESAKLSLMMAQDENHKSGIRENTANLKKWGAQ